MKKTKVLLIFMLFISSIVFSQDDAIYSTKDTEYIKIANNALSTYLEDYDKLVFGDFSLELDIVDSTYRSRIIRYNYCYKKIPIFKKSITLILSNNGKIEYMNRMLTPLLKPIDYNGKISKMGIKSIVESYLNKKVKSKYFKIDTRFELIEDRYLLVSNIETYVEGDFYNTYFKIKSSTGEIIEVLDKNINNKRGREGNVLGRSQDSESNIVTNVVQTQSNPNDDRIKQKAEFYNPDPEGSQTTVDVWCIQNGLYYNYLGQFERVDGPIKIHANEKFHYYDVQDDGVVIFDENMLYKSKLRKFSYDYGTERNKYLKLFAYYHTTNFIEDEVMQIGYKGSPRKLIVDKNDVWPKVFITKGAIYYTTGEYNPMSSDLFIVVQAAARSVLYDNDFGSLRDAMDVGYADYLAQSYRWIQDEGAYSGDHQCFYYGGQYADGQGGYLIRRTDYPYSYTDNPSGDTGKEQIWGSLWMFLEEKLGRNVCQAILKEVLEAGKDKNKQPDVAKIINEIIVGKNDISNFTKCEISSKIMDVYGEYEYNIGNNETKKFELADDYSSYSFHFPGQ